MKFIRQKDFTVVFDFLESGEVAAFNSFMQTNTWGEVEGDPHWSMNISSAEIGLIAQKIQLRLKSTIQNIYSCSLSDETLGTFVKYRLGYGLPLHYDAAKVDDVTGEKTINKTFSGCTTTDMTSILYLENDSIGGLISFPNLDMAATAVALYSSVDVSSTPPAELNVEPLGVAVGLQDGSTVTINASEFETTEPGMDGLLIMIVPSTL
jgi:hypothetical protein